MQTDLSIIKNIVKQASVDELLPRYTQVAAEYKADGSLVTEADIAMQNSIAAALQEHYPDTILLSEEMSKEEQQQALTAGVPVWCLDPLDGTSNFAAGIPYFAVSLSLIHHQNVIMGIVYDPIRDEFFSASDDQPARINDELLQPNESLTELNKSIAIIDFKRLNPELSTRLVQQQPFASQRNFGASALDWCWLAANRGQLYLHGRQNIWDYSAGQYIFEKAGGHSCTLEGETVYINQLEGRSVVAACNRTLHSNWMDWINKAD